MENNILNLRTENYYELEEELCFFMDPGRYAKFFEQVRSLAGDLLQAEYITCKHICGANNEDYYIMMTRSYQIFADRSDRQNFRITNLRWGKDFQTNKKKMYSNGAFFIIAKGGIKLVVKKESHSNGYTFWTSATQKTDSDHMTSSSIAKLCAAIDEYFENYNKTNDTKVGKLFDLQIIQPLKSYTHYEQLVEQLAVYGDNYMDYERREAVSGGARRKRYNFYSTSYDPESEMFSIGKGVAVETIEDINYERKRMLEGKIIDLVLVEDGIRMQIEFTQQFDDQILKEAHGHIYPQADKTQLRVRQEVIRNIWNGTIASKYMYQLFKNYRGSGYKRQPGWEEFRQELLGREYPPNHSQLEAIQKGIETDDIQLVLGPPGTGKTTVIGTWVEYFIRQGKRVLISSQNNAAVDNVLERIGQKAEARVVRLGNIEKIQENCKMYSVERQAEETAERYVKKLSQGKALFSADTNTVEEMLAYIDKAKKVYRTKGYYEQQIQAYGNLLRKNAKKVVDLYNQADQIYKRYEQCHCQKIHKQVYLYAINQKGKFSQWLHSRVTKQVEKDLSELKEMEKEVAVQYIRSIDDYNAASNILQKALCDNDYRNAYAMIHSLNEQCNSFSFLLSLQSQFLVKEPDIPDNLEGVTAQKRLGDYEVTLRNFKCRLGFINKTLDDWGKSLYSNRTDIVTKLLVQNSNVVGATCIGINSNRWAKELDFDVSIIDECGQIQIHDIIVPMTRAPKTLMLGDHKQIPPHVNEEVRTLCKQDGVDTELLEKSFFEFLFNKLEERDSNTLKLARLNEQFRMPKVISDVIADQFYNGNYHARYDMGHWNSMIRGMDSPLVVVTTSKNPERFEKDKHNSKDTSPGYSNLLEARLIADIISKTYIGHPEEVGIISAYSRQVRLIRQKLKQTMQDLSLEQVNSMVATLDSFQGQERPLIIYSLTRSNNYRESEQARVGFLKELRRLNVAFTRCQKQLVIIGDIDYLTSCKAEDEQEFSKFLLCMENQAALYGKIYEA